MTIGYILDDTLDRSDGVQQAVIAIGEHMRGLGHDVHYIVTETTRTDLKNIHAVGTYWSMNFNGNSVRTPRPVRKKAIDALFSEVAFDVLHVQMPHSPLLAGRVLHRAPKHVVCVGTFHILPYNWFARIGTRLLGLALRRSIKRLDRAYAVSEPARVFMQHTFGVAGAVLPNPVDYQFFNAFVRKNQVKKQIVYVGRFEERKGVEELVNAYSALSDQERADSELVMCSKGPLLEKIRNISDSRGLHIHLPGFVSEEEKAQYLANADIAVFPSKSGESFGIVLAEAMAAGASVTIGGNNPGYASVLAPWPETLFDPSDAGAFTALLSQLLADSATAAAIGTQQHEAVKQYDVQAVCERLLAEAYR